MVSQMSVSQNFQGSKCTFRSYQYHSWSDSLMTRTLFADLEGLGAAFLGCAKRVTLFA